MVSELSGDVEHFVNRIKQMPLSEAIFECIGPILDKNSDLESIAIFIAKKSVKLNPSSYLFADSTAVQGEKKILSRAQNWVDPHAIKSCRTDRDSDDRDDRDGQPPTYKHSQARSRTGTRPQ